MLRLFGSKTIVGLEFDTEFIRGVEVGNKNNQLTTLSHAKIAIPKDGMQEGLIVSQASVSQALKDLWQKGGFRSKDVVIGISNQEILIRFAHFPHVALNRLDTMVRFQAQDHLPIPLETVELDYGVIGSRNDGEKSQLELILVAGKKDMLQSFLQVLSNEKLNPLAIEVLPLTLLRLLRKPGLQKTVAIVNVGQGLGNMLIADDLTPRMARMMPVHWQEIDANSQGEPLGDLSRNIRSTIGFYQSNRGAKPVEKILLCGIEPTVSNLIDILKTELVLPIEIIEPLDALQVELNSGTNTVLGEYSLAISLACKEWE